MRNPSVGAKDNENAVLRLTELILRLKIFELRGERSQSEMILLLDSLGFKSGEIIRLTGASETTVRPILSRGRKSGKHKRRQ